MICPVTGQICVIDFDCQKDEHAINVIDSYLQLYLGEIVMACDHKTLNLVERTIYKEGIPVSDADVIMCPYCGYIVLARMKKKELKKAKKISAPNSRAKIIPPKTPVAKPQPKAVDNRLKNALKGELNKLGVTPTKTYGADNTPKPTGVNNNQKPSPLKTIPSGAQQGNAAVQQQVITPLKTEEKKPKKK
jgi:DNA-directed RNA polymerase subunit RPC12/RpoP